MQYLLKLFFFFQFSTCDTDALAHIFPVSLTSFQLLYGETNKTLSKSVLVITYWCLVSQHL